MKEETSDFHSVTLLSWEGSILLITLLRISPIKLRQKYFIVIFQSPVIIGGSNVHSSLSQFLQSVGSLQLQFLSRSLCASRSTAIRIDANPVAAIRPFPRSRFLFFVCCFSSLDEEYELAPPGE